MPVAHQVVQEYHVSVFNLLVASNDDFVRQITALVLNAHSARRARGVPVLDPADHFEHNEAKVSIALFDGPPPDDAELDAMASIPSAQQPEYYRAVVATVMEVLASFRRATGKDASVAKLDLNERGLLWEIAVTAIAPPKRAKYGRGRWHSKA